MKFSPLFLSLSVALVSLTSPSKAEEVTIYWKGAITSTTNWGSLPNEVVVGNDIYGTLRVDTDAYGFYTDRWVDYTTGGLDWKFEGMYIQLRDSANTINFVSDIGYGHWLEFPNAGNWVEINIDLFGPEPATRPWTVHELESFDPAIYPTGKGFFYAISGVGGETETGYYVNFQVSQVSLQPIPVPEPGVLSLAAVLAGALVCRRKRES